ncbi:hypothetical protein [Bradyrhizobium genosp. P]|uniref:hypothetical protein n=1 Tax=Bradyrhizobium genosp. P TaxID=83641 RepID=UPI003CF91EAB
MAGGASIVARSAALVRAQRLAHAPIGLEQKENLFVRSTAFEDVPTFSQEQGMRAQAKERIGRLTDLVRSANQYCLISIATVVPMASSI